MILGIGAPYLPRFVGALAGAATVTGSMAGAATNTYTGTMVGTVPITGAMAGTSEFTVTGTVDGAVPISGAMVGTFDSNQHRYWRVFIVTNNGDASFSGINELEMYEAEFGANQCTGGTALESSNAGGSFVAANAFDSVVVTTNAGSWVAGAAANQYLGYDFGSGVTKEIVSVGIYAPSSGTYTRAPASIHVQYSDNGSSWTTKWSDTLTFTADHEFQRSTYPSAPAGTAYPSSTEWKLDTLVANAALSCAELELRATTGGADQCSGGTMTAAGTALGAPADMIDNNNSTFWAANGAVWVQYTHGSGIVVKEVAWRIRGDSNPTHSPKDINVLFRNGSGPWSTAWTVRNQTAWTNGEQRVFTSPD